MKARRVTITFEADTDATIKQLRKGLTVSVAGKAIKLKEQPKVNVIRK